MYTSLAENDLLDGMVYTRGSDNDYDLWGKVAKDKKWSWKALAPYIKKVRLSTRHRGSAINAFLPFRRSTKNGFNLQENAISLDSTILACTDTKVLLASASHGAVPSSLTSGA